MNDEEIKDIIKEIKKNEEKIERADLNLSRLNNLKIELIIENYNLKRKLND